MHVSKNTANYNKWQSSEKYFEFKNSKIII